MAGRRISGKGLFFVQKTQVKFFSSSEKISGKVFIFVRKTSEKGFFRPKKHQGKVFFCPKKTSGNGVKPNYGTKWHQSTGWHFFKYSRAQKEKQIKAKNQLNNIIVHRKWKWHLDIADIDIYIDIVSWFLPHWHYFIKTALNSLIKPGSLNQSNIIQRGLFQTRF